MPTFVDLNPSVQMEVGQDCNGIKEVRSVEKGDKEEGAICDPQVNS